MPGSLPKCGCPSVAECMCTHRTCNKCGAIKPITEFSPDFPQKNSLKRTYRCLECRRVSDRELPSRLSGSHAEWQAAYYQKNKEHFKSYNATYRETNKERLKEYNRERQSTPEYKRWQTDYGLRRTYGITIDDYEVMLQAQGGSCAICFSRDARDPRNIRFHVDHDHETGLVRGLLCSDCNRGLGQFREDPERLERAADYVRKYRDTCP